MQMYFSHDFQEIMLVPWNTMKCIGLGWCLIIMTHVRRGKLQNRNSLWMETEHYGNDGKSYFQLHRWVYCCIFVQNCRCVILCWELCNFKKDANRLVWWVNIVYPDSCLVVHLFENPARVLTYCTRRSIRSSKPGFLDAIYWGRWLLEPLHPCNPLCLGQRNHGYHGYRVMLHCGWVIL